MLTAEGEGLFRNRPRLLVVSASIGADERRATAFPRDNVAIYVYDLIRYGEVCAVRCGASQTRIPISYLIENYYF